MKLNIVALAACLWVNVANTVFAFQPQIPHTHTKAFGMRNTALGMGVDLVTYLRTEWISAALVTNQIPRSFDVCLQLGTEDGRMVNFLPRTMRKLITSSAAADGTIPVSARRQLEQQNIRRGAGLKLEILDQRSDDLSGIEDESVDCVVSLLAAQQMVDNGLDWQQSLIEATRVLKPGGRLLFVEQTTVEGFNYLDVVKGLTYVRKGEDDESEEVREPVFEEVGSDPCDLTLVPHIAGVAIKAEDAGLSKEEKDAMEKKKESDVAAERAFMAFERGRKKKKVKKAGAGEGEGEEAMAGK